MVYFSMVWCWSLSVFWRYWRYDFP